MISGAVPDRLLGYTEMGWNTWTRMLDTLRISLFLEFIWTAWQTPEHRDIARHTIYVSRSWAGTSVEVFRIASLVSGSIGIECSARMWYRFRKTMALEMTVCIYSCCSPVLSFMMTAERRHFNS